MCSQARPQAKPDCQAAASPPEHTMGSKTRRPNAGRAKRAAVGLSGLLSGLLSLLNQRILHRACVAVQQCRGLSSEVVQNFKTFCADVCEILVAREIALLTLDAARDRSLCLCRLGIGRCLLGQIGLEPRS